MYTADYILLHHGCIALQVKDTYTKSNITRHITIYIVDWYSNITKDKTKQIYYTYILKNLKWSKLYNWLCYITIYIYIYNICYLACYTYLYVTKQGMLYSICYITYAT